MARSGSGKHGRSSHWRNSGERRRRLLLHEACEPAPAAADEEPAPRGPETHSETRRVVPIERSESDAADADQPASPEPAAGKLASFPQADVAAPGTATVASAGLRAIHRLLESQAPLVWVFTGEDLQALSSDARDFSEHFGHAVKRLLGRFRDAVVNTSGRETRCSDLLGDLAWRVTRFQPEVVLLTLGTSDSVAGGSGRAAFRQSLQKLVVQLRDAGSLVLLNTPHAVTDAAYADLPAYVESVRWVAEAEGVALVDHWQRWQQTHSNSNWLEDDGVRPNRRGHWEMAATVCQALNVLETPPLKASGK